MSAIFCSIFLEISASSAGVRSLSSPELTKKITSNDELEWCFGAALSFVDKDEFVDSSQGAEHPLDQIVCTEILRFEGENDGHISE